MLDMKFTRIRTMSLFAKMRRQYYVVSEQIVSGSIPSMVPSQQSHVPSILLSPPNLCPNKQRSRINPKRRLSLLPNQIVEFPRREHQSQQHQMVLILARND